MKPLKVLVSGDVCGNFDKLLKRVSAVNKKAGPFEMLICVGRFLGPKGGEDLLALRARAYDFPISTYVLAPEDDDELGESGLEICPNVTNLGPMGLYKTGGGLTIAYCARTASETQVKSFLNNVVETEKDGVDVLLTCQWPENVMEFSTDPDKFNRLDALHCSKVVSIVARCLRPRYHFAALQGLYYERLPYRNHRVLVDQERHATRFVGLAQCGSTAEKWLYAFNVVPMRAMDPKDLRAQPPDVTESPYRDEGKFGMLELAKRADEAPKQYFYDFGGRGGGGRGRGGRGRGRGRGRGMGYDGPDGGGGGGDRRRTMEENGGGFGGDDSTRPKQPRTSCWFCLASPEVAKHLVVTVGEQVYLALAKGGLVPGQHVMILPIEHFHALYAKEGLESLREEVEKLKSALRRYFETKNMACVFYERNYKSSHSQLHAVPIPAASESSCCEEILNRIKDSDVSDFKILPKFADIKQIAGRHGSTNYLYVELPDGRRVFGKLPSPQRGVDDQHILTLMSAVLADVLDVQERLDWRKCVESVEEETSKRDKFSKEFEAFDPFADE